MKGKTGRRKFLKTTSAVMALTAGIGSSALSESKITKSNTTIPQRTLGKTGITLPILGYGGAALPKTWGNPLSFDERVKLVRYAYDSGLRYFDTAGNYMESQPILGEALRYVRKNIFLASKVETLKPSKVRKDMDKILKELQTDYLDLIQIHGSPGVEQMSVQESMDIHGELIKLRDEGIVRFIGFTAHSYFDKALELINTEAFDQCMLSYGYLPRGYNQVLSARMVELRNACVARAHELDMGLVAMKVVGAGILGAWSQAVVPEFDKEQCQQLPGAAIRHVLKDKRIQVLMIGMRLTEEIDANIRIITENASYSETDQALLARFSAKALDRDPLKSMRVD